MDSEQTIEVTLTREEIYKAHLLGGKATIEYMARQAKFTNPNPNPEERTWERLDADMYGKEGEFAAAKALGRPIKDGFSFDVGDLQIRTVDSPTKRLRIKEKDILHNVPCVLVCMNRLFNRYILKGWYYPKEIKPEWWMNQYEAYFVPNELLRPMNTLPLDEIDRKKEAYRKNVLDDI